MMFWIGGMCGAVIATLIMGAFVASGETTFRTQNDRYRKLLVHTAQTLETHGIDVKLQECIEEVLNDE